MTEEKIKKVTELFAKEAKKIYGEKIKKIILYGSCARGDFQADSDIDILLLLNVPKEDLATERKKIFAVADALDLEYEVVLAPVLQSYEVYQNYLSVSAYYQSVQKEGVMIA
ncbi:MAG: nucleotidyltransferase domain-containing protein [Anaerovoracaceae bacterium]